MAASSSRGKSASLIQSVRDYVSRMASDVSGMKVLVMDQETTGIVSMVYTQTQILQHEVFLIDSIERARADKMAHLKAIYFLRPTHDNVRLLQEEFKDPKYGEYHIFFSNTTRDAMIQQLAEADEHEVVQQVQEYYADFLAINPDLASLNVPSTAGLADGARWDQPVFDRAQQGVCALLLALKKRPLIRYTAKSEVCMRLAESVLNTIDSEPDLYAFRKPEVAPLLLLLDRRDDPVTPLLNQWTYQAMVHELLGLENGRVDLRGRAGAAKGQEQVVLSERQDAFFREHMYENYGDLGLAIKAMVDDFQTATKGNRNLQSIEDMQRFVESYPEFRQRQGNVSKHVALMSELSRAVEERALMGVSELEQELACGNLGCSQACEEVLEAMGRPRVRHEERLRLVMLFALRYESSGAEADLARLVRRLAELGVSAERQGLVKTIVQHAGEEQRAGDLYSSRNFASRFAGAVKKGLKGVDNVYTQHQPLLATTLEAAARGKLPEAAYPSVAVGGAGGAGGGGGGGAGGARDVVAFIVGGTTFEEARAVHLLNSSGEVPGNFLLGGTRVLNSKAYLEDLLDLQRAYRRQR